MEYLCSVSGGRKETKVAKEITSDAIKYLATTKTSCSWEDCLLDIHSLRAYVDRL